MSFYLKSAIWAVFFCIFSSFPAASQIYRVYRPVANTQWTEETSKVAGPVWLEISAQGIISAGQISDDDGGALSRLMWGSRIQILGRTSDYLALGIEGEMLKSSDKATGDLSYITRHSIACVFKWTLTPATEPKIYMISGMGMAFNYSTLELSVYDLDTHSVLWLLGVGGELKMGEHWLAVGEIRWMYDMKRWQNFVLHANSSFRGEVGVGVVYLF